MPAHFNTVLLAAASALLTACGGSADRPSRETPQLVSPLAVDALLDWAERTYPELFPGHEPTLFSAPYEYRYYPQTGNYAGVAADDVYVYGPVSGQQLQKVGTREDFRCRVQPQDCGGGYARAGWTTTLSTLAHGVSGTVTIVDSRTLRVTGFRYDGLAPQVYAYLGAGDQFHLFAQGRPIGAEIERRRYAGETIELKMPEGQSLDGFNALSIWCVQFRVNFGSGSFAPPQ